jgi:hypothetical protein
MKTMREMAAESRLNKLEWMREHGRGAIRHSDRLVIAQPLLAAAEPVDKLAATLTVPLRTWHIIVPGLVASACVGTLAIYHVL